ncbi:MAG TPA: MBL fold metallo-hydrolase, partial [Candidatus Polarisedimenticolaceae bacterium]|nr:MBL fold metallo-hydrolase [Candidatus Polarisedimenticolaceae bacterium]
PGTRETLEGLAGLCYREVFEMREFDLRYHELPVAVDNGVAVGSGLVLDTLPMRHHPSSIGLRFRLAGSGGDAVVAVSGDTGWCDNLERLARGCDLLLLECTSVEPLTDVHISLRELRDKADRLDATRIVLVHLDDAVAADLSLDPIPRVGAATDDLTIEFP